MWGEVSRRESRRFCAFALLSGAGAEGCSEVCSSQQPYQAPYLSLPPLEYSSRQQELFPGPRKTGLSVPNCQRWFWVVLHYKEKKKVGPHNNSLEWQVGENYWRFYSSICWEGRDSRIALAYLVLDPCLNTMTKYWADHSKLWARRIHIILNVCSGVPLWVSLTID